VLPWLGKQKGAKGRFLLSQTGKPPAAGVPVGRGGASLGVTAGGVVTAVGGDVEVAGVADKVDDVEAVGVVDEVVVVAACRPATTAAVAAAGSRAARRSERDACIVDATWGERRSAARRYVAEPFPGSPIAVLWTKGGTGERERPTWVGRTSDKDQLVLDGRWDAVLEFLRGLGAA